MALEELSFKSVKGRTDNGQKVITIAHPELINKQKKKKKKNGFKKKFCKALTCFILILFLYFKGGNSEVYLNKKNKIKKIQKELCL